MKAPEWVLLVLALALALSGLVWRRGGAQAEFAGADQLAVKAAGEPAMAAAPIWRPPSQEVETGLFALQAAAGGVLLGYVLGRRSRHAP